MSKTKKFSLDQVIDPSSVTVTDVGLLSLNIDKSIRVDEFPSKLSFISNLSASFYMHLGHSFGFVTSIPVMLKVEDFTDDYLSALDNVRLNNASLEVIDEPSMVFFTFDRDDLIDCAPLFELGSLESNFDNDNDSFLLTPKNALASELMSLVQSRLTIEDIDDDSENSSGYGAEFFDSLKKCLIEDLGLLHEESAVHVSDISLTEDKEDDESIETETKPSQSEVDEDNKTTAKNKDEAQPVDSKVVVTPEAKKTPEQKPPKQEAKSIEKKDSVEPVPKKQTSSTRNASKPKSIKDPSVSNPLAAASAIIDKGEDPNSIHDDLFSVNDPKDISDDISSMQESFDGLREPDGY